MRTKTLRSAHRTSSARCWCGAGIASTQEIKVTLLGTGAELIPRTRSNYAGPVEVGEDLMTILIGDRVDVRRFIAPVQ
jgi:hypothetical protein